MLTYVEGMCWCSQITNLLIRAAKLTMDPVPDIFSR